MTAFILQQLLALYFAIIYSWQLSVNKKSLIGNKIHPDVSRTLQIYISFFHLYFILFYFINSYNLRYFNQHISIHGARSPPSSAPKGNSRFEILLVKIFSLKQKSWQILPATIGKIKFCLFKKITSCSQFCVNTEKSNYAFKWNAELQCGNVKQKPFRQVYTYLRIFPHISAQSGIRYIQ